MKRRLLSALLSLLFAAMPLSAVLADGAVGIPTAGQVLYDAIAKKLDEAAKASGDAAPGVVVGADGWLYLPAELRHISVGKFWGAEAAKVSRATNPENADPLPAILDFKAQLAAAGVELILVPVPAKAFVYPDPLLGEKVGADGKPLPRMDVFHEAFIAELRKNGVTVVDLLPDFLARRNAPAAAKPGANGEIGGPVFCKTDTHWSGAGIQIAAQKIAALMMEKPWFKALDAAAKTPTVSAVRPTEILGDLEAMRGGTARESVLLNFVGTAASNGATPIAPEKQSPVLLLGDSHTLVFQAGGDMHASGAGLADQLAALLQFPVDLIGVRGSGATPARVNLMRRMRGDAGYLAGKKVVVWCFTEREFTEAGGWNKVPLSKPKAAQ